MRLGEVFGPKVNLSGTLGRAIKQVIDAETIKIKGEGLEKEYFIYIDDASEAIVRALLTKNTNGKIFPISYEKPISAIELAYLIKSITDNTKIEFEKEDKYIIEIPEVKNIQRDNLSILGWKPRKTLEEGIKETFAYNNYTVKSRNLFSIAQDIKRSGTLAALMDAGLKEKAAKVSPGSGLTIPRGIVKPPILKRALIAAFLIGGLYILLPTVLFCSNFYLSIHNLQNSKIYLDKGDFSKSQTYAKRALDQANRATNLPPIAKLILKKDFVHIANASKYYADSLAYIIPVLNTLNHAKDALPPNSVVSEVPKEEFENGVSNITKSKELLSLAEAELNAYKDPPNIFSKDILSIKQHYPNAASDLKDLETVFPVMPKILGFDKEKRYLVLIENSSRLTPSGGVINSIAKITVQNGRIKDILIDDAPNVQSAMEAKNFKIETSKEAQEVLGQDALTIENINFDPQFSSTTQNIIKVYKDVYGENIDGVFAISLPFIKDLLSFSGPVFLTDYGQDISADNVYEKAQYFSGYVNNTSERTFLSNLIYKTSDAIFSNSLKGEGTLDILKNFRENQILFFSADPEIENSLYALSWSGNILPSNTNFLYALDTNIGGTNTNLYVTRSFDYSITRDSDLYKGLLKISYKHTGRNNAWPGGAYKAYVRIYTPYQTQLNKAVQLGATEIDITKDVKSYEKNGKTIFPFTVLVNAGEEKTFSFEYILPAQNKVYQLLFQKQPGLINADKVNGKSIYENSQIDISIGGN